MILREKFGLKYRAANAANTKYNDTTYDEKRLWVSRLLAQFLLADVIVISIDESSFKQEGIRHRYWQASSSTIKQLYRQNRVMSRNQTELRDPKADESAEVLKEKDRNIQ